MANDKQESGTGKVQNDHNSQSDKEPTQKNEARRTPESRHDREAHVGSGNQAQSRQGAAGSSSGGGGRGAG
ncbi:MAG: hypothetical protein EOO31_02000 [Comamonadaceae bacterium]|nr:MAG: hypothetical protein EOO31_02000 [Comamonadaceae bacterium]